MTRESWAGGTWSHAWGTAVASAVASGLVGVRATRPAFDAFDVQPRLGGLERASLRFPTLAGPVDVEANATHTSVAAPCGTRATVCVRAPDAARALRAGDGGGATVVVDGAKHARGVSARGSHVCAEDLGCGADGAARVVSVVA